MHDVDAVGKGANEPIGQGVHEKMAPSDTEYMPAGHCTHEAVDELK